MAQAHERPYKATESKYKGGAEEMYVTYDLVQKTRGKGQTLYHHVKRVYVAGDVKGWQVGTFEKRTGKQVHGVKLDYEQERAGYTRKGYTASRDGVQYEVQPARITGSKATFSKIVAVPQSAQNVQFHTGTLPEEYRSALQDVR